MSYDYDELRQAVVTVRRSLNLDDVIAAATLLADYVEATLNHADEVGSS